jgi:hypothetical protein
VSSVVDHTSNVHPIVWRKTTLLRVHGCETKRPRLGRIAMKIQSIYCYFIIQTTVTLQIYIYVLIAGTARLRQVQEGCHVDLYQQTTTAFVFSSYKDFQPGWLLFFRLFFFLSLFVFIIVLVSWDDIQHQHVKQLVRFLLGLENRVFNSIDFQYSVARLNTRLFRWNRSHCSGDNEADRSEQKYLTSKPTNRRKTILFPLTVKKAIFSLFDFVTTFLLGGSLHLHAHIITHCDCCLLWLWFWLLLNMLADFAERGVNLLAWNCWYYYQTCLCCVCCRAIISRRFGSWHLGSWWHHVSRFGLGSFLSVRLTRLPAWRCVEKIERQKSTKLIRWHNTVLVQ